MNTPALPYRLEAELEMGTVDFALLHDIFLAPAGERSRCFALLIDYLSEAALAFEEHEAALNEIRDKLNSACEDLEELRAEQADTYG